MLDTGSLKVNIVSISERLIQLLKHISENRKDFNSV